VDVIWGELASIAAGGPVVQLGTVHAVDCGGTSEGYHFDSLRPDPGSVDFVLVREVGAAGYGKSTAGKPRVPDGGDCP
jgi:hypothetical protein